MTTDTHVRLPDDLYGSLVKLKSLFRLPSINAAIVMVLVAGLKHYGMTK